MELPFLQSSKLGISNLEGQREKVSRHLPITKIIKLCQFHPLWVLPSPSICHCQGFNSASSPVSWVVIIPPPKQKVSFCLQSLLSTVLHPLHCFQFLFLLKHRSEAVTPSLKFWPQRSYLFILQCPPGYVPSSMSCFSTHFIRTAVFTIS